LTLAGVRRMLTVERPGAAADDPTLSNIGELLGKDARERLLYVKRGLRDLSRMRTPASVERRRHASRPRGPVRPAGERGRTADVAASRVLFERIDDDRHR
jgi:hypothetical protein